TIPPRRFLQRGGNFLPILQIFFLCKERIKETPKKIAYPCDFGRAEILKPSRPADMCRRLRHRQGNFAQNCVRGACDECAILGKILSKGIPKRAAEPSAACGGY